MTAEPRPGAKLLAPIWPALTALLVVAVLSIGMVTADIIIDHRTTVETTTLIDDALKSIALADNIRAQIHSLVTERDEGKLAEIGAQLDADLHAYDTLLVVPAERPHWEHLKLLLAEGRLDRAGLTPSPEIDTTLDRIVEYNRREAIDAVDVISDTDRRGIWFSTACVVITLGLAAVIATWFVRASRRHRALLDTHLDVLDDRSRELEAFAGRVAHDLRGPLAPIRGYADLLAEQVPDARSAAARIGRATERMSSIIDDLLALSVSGQAGDGEAEVAPIVREVVDELVPPGTELDLDLDNCAARCSPSVLRQLVGNLVGNAVKYRSLERPLDVEISCTCEGSVVEICVVDNGIGMDEETAEHAFEPLFRASSVRNVSGHGLGLAIVKRTIDALGGTCSLTSKLDRGTCVMLRIPSATSA